MKRITNLTLIQSARAVRAHDSEFTRRCFILAGLLCVILTQTAFVAMAMPSYRYVSQTAQANYQPDLDGWAALYMDPLYRSSFDTIFNARTLPEMDGTGGNAWLEVTPSHLLSSKDRRAMRNLYESLKSAAENNGSSDLNGLGLENAGNSHDLFGNARATGHGDLLGEIRRNADNLMADAARTTDDELFGKFESMDPEGPEQTSYGTLSNNVNSNRPAIIRPRLGPSLANTPLGALGIEALKPILQASGMLSDSLMDLRHYVLIEQPKSSTLMMMDGGSGQALVMLTTNEVSMSNRTAAEPDQSVRTQEHAGTPRMISDDTLLFLNKPFRSLMWDIISSTAALIIYGLLFIAWLAWRKVISHHV